MMDDKPSAHCTPSFYEDAKTGVSARSANRKLRLKEVVAALEEAGLDPMVEICTILQSGELEPAIKVKTLLSLAEFVHPKKRAAEITGQGGGPLVVTWQS